jgi:hypothetical protein
VVTARVVEQAAERLQRVGFAVIERPRVDLRVAYDRAVAASRADDVRQGRSCLRVRNFVDRGPDLDALPRDPVLLAICDRVFPGGHRLSSVIARAVDPGKAPQDLHADLESRGDAIELLGYIWMIDAFTAENGATRIVPRDGGEPVVAVGAEGSLLVYDGALLHGYGVNHTTAPRRSIQGGFVSSAWRG